MQAIQPVKIETNEHGRVAVNYPPTRPICILHQRTSSSLVALPAATRRVTASRSLGETVSSMPFLSRKTNAVITCAFIPVYKRVVLSDVKR